MYITFLVEPYLAALRDFTGTPGNDATIISVAELLCLLSLAAVQHRSWDGRVVLYVRDNDNVRVWLGARHARNRMARHLLRLLRYLEVRGHFVVVNAYATTYLNQLQDFLSRETQEVVDTEMHRLGYLRAESAGPWEEVLRRGYGRRVHALPGADGDDWQLAAQLAYRSDSGPVTAQLENTSWSGVKIVELFSGTPSPGARGRGIRSGSHSSRRHPSGPKPSREGRLRRGLPDS